MRAFAAPAVLAACLACGTPHAQVSATPDPVGDALRYALPLGAAALTFYHQDTEGL